MAGPPQILTSTLVVLPVDIVQPGTAPLPDLVPSDNTRPQVILTFAQSIDAKIAGAGGRQLFLSSEESMKMTHWMRTMHDGIFIGVSTAVNDNPQLNVLPPPSSYCSRRISAAFTTITNAAKGVGVSPWVISAPPPKIEGFFASEDDGEKLQRWEARRDVLQAAGATVILVEPRQYIPIFPQQPPAFPSELSCARFARKASAQSWSKVAIVSYNHFYPSASSMH